MLDRGYKRFRISLMNNNSLQGKNQKLTHTKFYLRQYELSKSDVFSVKYKKNTERNKLYNHFERRSAEPINSKSNRNKSFYAESSGVEKTHCVKKNKQYLPQNKQSYSERYELDLLGINDMQQDDSFPIIKAKRFTIKKKKTFIDTQIIRQNSMKQSTNYGPWQNPQQSNLQIHEYS